MELLLETVAERQELSTYEIERNKPMPSKNHSIVQSNLIFALKLKYRNNLSVFSELDLIMPEKPNAVPDLAIYRNVEIDFFEDEVGMDEMPMIAVEIVSPSQSEGELVRKINRYFDAGVKSCWLVNPLFQSVYVYSAKGKYQFFNAGMTLSDPATNIEIALDEVFTA